MSDRHAQAKADARESASTASDTELATLLIQFADDMEAEGRARSPQYMREAAIRLCVESAQRGERVRRLLQTKEPPDMTTQTPPPGPPRSRRPLSLWTVYERPDDCPEGYIARRFEINCARVLATTDALTAETIDALRAKMPLGLFRLERLPDDMPEIVETWI